MLSFLIQEFGIKSVQALKTVPAKPCQQREICSACNIKIQLPGIYRRRRQSRIKSFLFIFKCLSSCGGLILDLFNLAALSDIFFV